MDYEALTFTNFGALNTAVTEMTQMIGKLEKLQTQAETELDGKSRKAAWAGVNATVTREFISKTAREFGQAVTEATSIRNILRDTHGELTAAQQELKGAVEAARQRDIHVIGLCGGWGFRVEGRSPGGSAPAPSQGEVDGVVTQIEGILKRATESDTSAAEALKGLVSLAKTGFSSAPVIEDRDHAGTAVQREKIRLQGIELSEKYRKETKWPFEWGPDGKHPRGRDAEYEDYGGIHWAERDLLKQRPWEALTYKEVSEWALAESQAEKARNPNIDQNAYRHSIWQARLTYELGPESAERWADAHEAYYPKNELPDHRADLVNNVYGRGLGQETMDKVPPKYLPNYSGGPPVRINGEEVNQYIIEQARQYAQSERAATPDHFAPR
ncbi:hypothetical protein SRB5_62410 [Streptomyces sp. RB5]|uniref:DUF6973 domain-containing protein n=1 Tax=Streptomyces smaragdinus TaxID=2585196 RepID=A0A7K0CRG7_9ACTN|nr:hypothetical protein [Streptomyces smaragdinus]MQY16049.1 hypothetical protein [Streptomyces smaragdinus]